MKRSRAFDFAINVLLPLILGYIIYLLTLNHKHIIILGNYLPDGLWAYALLSSVLIIWDRQKNIFWIIFIYIAAALFEIFQYLHFISGTGDILDILVYYIFFTFVLAANNLLKNTFLK